MSVTKLFRTTNRSTRFVVGMFLASMLAIQCLQTLSADSSDYLLAAEIIPVEPNCLSISELSINEKLIDMAKTDHVALLEYCLQNYNRNYTDYTGTFIKQERIKGKLGKEQWIDISFMDKPFSVAMNWIKNPPIGDRVLYVAGKFSDKMLVRPTNGFLRILAPTVARMPAGADAMKNTLSPITKFGFKNGLQSLIEIYKLARGRGECTEKFAGMSKINGRDVIVLERFLPKKPGYPVHKSKIYIDAEYLVPVTIEGYDWNDRADGWANRLICRYQYKDIKFNVGLENTDFAPSKLDLKAPR